MIMDKNKIDVETMTYEEILAMGYGDAEYRQELEKRAKENGVTFNQDRIGNGYPPIDEEWADGYYVDTPGRVFVGIF